MLHDISKTIMEIRFLRVLRASFVLLASMSQVLAVNMQVHNVSVRCTERERQSLLALKQGLIVPGALGYGRLDSWDGENQKECCEWKGVWCSEATGHVIKIDLSDEIEMSLNYTEGTISPSLAELHYLMYLDLSFNAVKGKIPIELGNLSRLVYLNLRNNDLSGRIPHQFGNLSFLRVLDLSSNFLSGTIPQNLECLSNLRYLDLSSNHIDYYGNVRHLRSDLQWVSHLTSLNTLHLATVDLSEAKNWIQQVSNISHLSELDFSSCNLFDSEPWHSVSININVSSVVVINLYTNKLTSSIFPSLLTYSRSLRILQLDDNYLTGPIPEAFGNFSSLHELYLADNMLDGGIPKSLLDLCGLRFLGLSGNNLSGRLDEFVPTSSQCPKKSLEELYLSGNQIAGSVPDLSQFSSLQSLYLDSNHLNGTISDSIGELSNLEKLRVRHNSLQGVINETHFSKLSRLQELDLSFNELVFNVSSDWVPPFQLNFIKLASCKLGPTFPIWLQTQQICSWLDISNAGISDTIPDWFSTLPLQSLNLSHNQIRGEISNLLLQFSSFYHEMDLSSNLFEGPIPSSLIWKTSNLDLSNNKFTDANSLLCPNMATKIFLLDISNNHFSGMLPNCWTYFESLVFLNVANNSFYGKIPVSMGSLGHIKALHLGNNRFIGGIPSSLKKCTELRILDVAQNNLSGLIPRWFGDHLNQLRVLSLRNNFYFGTIPSNICHLSQVQILDLSMNNISGTIPKCLGNLTALATQTSSNATITYLIDENFFNGQTFGSESYDDSASLIWKGKESEYRSTLGLVRIIDLSSNMLNGEIPSEVMDLIGLVSLNISRNVIRGEIPPTIGRLKSLDSLDLSWNHLSGKIPSQLSQIDRLGVLNLSYNNLSGEIPHGTQLQSFEAFAYIGNEQLCGAPLSECPIKQTEIGQNDEKNNDDEQVFGQGFYISLTLGFSMGFWGVCCSLLLKKSWRYAYFKLLSDAYDEVYVVVAINMAKFKRWIRASTWSCRRGFCTPNLSLPEMHILSSSR